MVHFHTHHSLHQNGRIQCLSNSLCHVPRQYPQKASPHIGHDRVLAKDLHAGEATLQLAKARILLRWAIRGQEGTYFLLAVPVPKSESIDFVEGGNLLCNACICIVACRGEARPRDHRGLVHKRIGVIIIDTITFQWFFQKTSGSANPGGKV